MKSSSDSEDAKQTKQSAEFLLEEFRQRFEHWRHADNRFEHLVNYYITVMGAVVAAFGVIYSTTGGTSLAQLLVIYMFVAPFLIIYGQFVTRRASTTAVMQIRQLNSINLIRRYFWERDKDIGPYLGRYKTKNGLMDVPLIFAPNDEFKHLKPDWHDKTVHFVYVINAFMLFAFVILLLYWFSVNLPFHKSRIHMLIDVGASSFIFVVLLFLYFKKRYDKGKEKLKSNRA